MREFFLKLAANIANVLVVMIIFMVLTGFLESVGIIPRMQTEASPPTEPAWFPEVTA